MDSDGHRGDQGFETLQVAVDGDGICVCTFNRPQARNALNLEMVGELHALLDGIEGREDVRVVVFAGAGEKAFVSGADIGELKERRQADAFRRINTDLFRRIEGMGPPSVAAIRGVALGGGLELAMACDLRVCGEGARLGQPEVSLGILPGAGGCYRLPKLVGLGRARELIFTGRLVDASEALAIGLVNRVVPDEQVLEAAMGLAAEVARNSPLAVRLAKQLLNAAGDMSVDAAMRLESTSQAILFEDDEKERRMAAFLARKKGG